MDRETGERKRERATEVLVLLFHSCLLRLETLGVTDLIFEVYIVHCWCGLRSGFWSLLASLLCLRVQQVAGHNNNVRFGRP